MLFMSTSPEVQRLIEELAEELKSSASAEARRATRSYFVSQGFMIGALACSVAAAVSGIFFSVSPKTVGGLAALPPLIAYVAVNLKFESRENWYYRESVALESLRSRLKYQLPEEPSVDNVAAIAEARDKLTTSMQGEWYQTITKGLFESLAKHSSADQSKPD
jgi:hypothetical protein